MHENILTNLRLNSNLFDIILAYCQIIKQIHVKIDLTYDIDKTNLIDTISDKRQIGSIDENG
jgi:hypothetical protein